MDMEDYCKLIARSIVEYELVGGVVVTIIEKTLGRQINDSLFDILGGKNVDAIQGKGGKELGRREICGDPARKGGVCDGIDGGVGVVARFREIKGGVEGGRRVD